MHDVDKAVADLAATQHGAVSVVQARRLGLDWEARRRRLEWRRWILATPRVLVLSGSADTFDQRATIALLDGGFDAGLAGPTATALWGAQGFDLEPIHVGRPRVCRMTPPTGVIHHNSRLWLPGHRLLLNGLPVTSPARTIVDLANLGWVHPKKWQGVVENFWSRDLVNRAALESIEREWCKRGRGGSALLHEFLAAHPVEWRPAESNLERRFIDIITEAGMPAPRSQVDVGNRTRWIGRVDCVDPQYPLIAEIDSDLYHAAPLAEEADAARDEALTDAGYRIIRFREFDVWHNKRKVVDEWRAARDQARRSHPSHHELVR